MVADDQIFFSGRNVLKPCNLKFDPGKLKDHHRAESDKKVEHPPVAQDVKRIAEKPYKNI
jgi:hypothetical protein